MDFPPFMMVYHKQLKSPIPVEPRHEEVDRFDRVGNLVDDLKCSGFPNASQAVPDEERPVVTLDDFLSSIRFRGDETDRRGT